MGFEAVVDVALLEVEPVDGGEFAAVDGDVGAAGVAFEASAEPRRRASRRLSPLRVRCRAACWLW
jgi:hypothetical protein